ncbi:ribonuclease HI family protein [Fundicoccus culcitae]|uniref:Ribonuclease HI family protein n=1 Tax=Fundicoccus culcitae TaxID=2969821 RepID=A0ABY5P7A4_9LACT|nr:ribonuclease HI family protein [Fundicoccus culcitae]UUX34323.1 ribonuclease HI family protein [Fundicoccus culcitae]
MIKIYCDGSFQQDTKKAGIGILFYYEDEPIRFQKALEGLNDNHEAEFMAIIHAFQELNKRDVKNQLIVIHTDSKIVANSIDKQFAKNPTYHDLLQQILQLMDPYTLAFVKWIPEKSNQAADALAKQALRK